jgi:phosphatidylglycerophosphate synthase
MKNKIPEILLYSRLIFALVIIAITLYPFFNSKLIILSLMYLGLLSDVFDGIIARKLNISTENFRVLDTAFDLLFYFSILFFIISTNQHVFSDHKIFILIIVILEAHMYVISMMRFGKLPSPHAILSKFWGLYIIVEFTLLICQVRGNHFLISLIVGMFVHVDRVLIYILLRNWEHDIPSSYHALLIRQGKKIKRLKMFNG